MARPRLAGAAAVVLVATVALLLLVPAIVERAVLGKLAALGFEDASLEVVEVSLHRLRFRDLRIGRELVIASTDLELDLWPPTSPRVRTIRVRGARLLLGGGAATSNNQSAGARHGGELPFDRLEIRNSEVVILDAVRVPFEATVESTPDRKSAALSLAASAVVLDPRLRVETATLSAEAEIHAAEWRIDRLQLRARVERAVAGEVAIDRLILAAVTDGDSIEWNVDARGPSFESERFGGRLPSRLAEWKSAPLAVSFAFAVDPELLAPPSADVSRFGRVRFEGEACAGTAPLRAELEGNFSAGGGDLGFGPVRLSSARASGAFSGSLDANGLSLALERTHASIARADLASAQLTDVQLKPSGEVLLEVGSTPHFEAVEQITWKALSLGKLALGAGSAKMAVESPGAILIERAETHLPEGGTLRLDAFRFKPGAERLVVQLRAEDLSIARWLALVAPARISGEGRLSGYVPLQVALGTPARVTLGRGELRAEPGAKLRVKDLETARALIAQAGLEATFGQLVKDRLLEALQELTLSELEFQIIPRAKDVDLTMHLAGHGTRGARQEIGGLTVNFHNFGTGLNQAMRLSGQKDRTKEEKNDPILELFQ